MMTSEFMCLMNGQASAALTVGGAPSLVPRPGETSLLPEKPLAILDFLNTPATMQLTPGRTSSLDRNFKVRAFGL
jgi:hypothetical protein